MRKHRHWKEITVTHHKLSNYGQIFGHNSQGKKNNTFEPTLKNL